MIFPEGGIRDNAPKLAKFKSGAFKTAIETKVPIVPITFLDNWKLLGDGNFFKAKARFGKARIIVHKPIETSSLTEEDLLPLSQNVFNIINKTLIENGEN